MCFTRFSQVFVPKSGQKLYDHLFEVGKEFNVKPGCPNLIERIESGLLSYGNDFDNNDNPLECGFDQYVSLDNEINFLGKEKLKKIKQLISSNEQVLNLSNLKILPIGSNQYLALINLDYRDSLKDEEIITVNSSLINSIKNSEPSISEIYFNPQ